jgi:hypothetical protein
MLSARELARSGASYYENRLTRRIALDEGRGRDRDTSPAAQLLDGFFRGEVASFREAYVAITGDKRITGRAENVDWNRMQGMFRATEAVDTTTLGDALGAALNRRLEEDYQSMYEAYDVWRKFAKVVRLRDFRPHDAVRMGGYGPLPSVAEGAPYQALSSPADEKASYSATKRGGLETVTLEAIRNDDVGLLRQIPERMVKAAKRTLHEFVLDFLRTNPVIYDGLNLFHATHNNTGSAALSAVSLFAAWNALRKQTEYGTGERLGLRGKYLLVPVDLQESAYNMLVRNTNNDRFFIQNQGIEVVVALDWTDANDWVLAADPAVRPGIEVGFIDGREQPEVVVSDRPAVGSLFANDGITLKIRHVYGGVVTDFRPFYKAVVA